MSDNTSTVDWTNDQTIYQGFSDFLWRDIEDEPLERRPLLAHYTSLRNIENILTSNEIWLSHPLHMNDFEELRFGMLEARDKFLSSPEVRRIYHGHQNQERLTEHFLDYFEERFSLFEADLFDTYLFCLCEHDPDDNHGLLSMWRGYGGDGAGAALIIDTSKIELLDESPLVLTNVTYLSQNDRREWLRQKTDEFAQFLRANLPTGDRLYLALDAFFQRILMFALATKHDGFHEEREWRLIYSKSRDRSHVAEPYLDYHVSDTGIEPKMKLPIKTITGLIGGGVRIGNIVDRLLLGPSLNTNLAVRSAQRMMTKYFPEAESNVIVSSIPYRRTSS